MDEQQLNQEIITVDDRVNAIVVKDQETYEMAGAAVLDLEALAKRITQYWEEPIKKAFEAHRALTAKRNEMLKPVEDRKKSLRKRISDYLTAKENERREAQRKADEERRKKEEAERAKLEARAAKAEEKGKVDKAEALREQASEVYVPPVEVLPEVEKTTHMDSGTISQKKDIRVTVVDPMEIVKQVAAGRLPVGIIKINEVALKQSIKLQNLNSVPGCVIEHIVTGNFRKGVA